MLVEFRVKNFKSIKDEQVLSMVASNGTENPDNVIEAGGLRLLKSVAIYGANASGKSNLLLALYAMRRLVANSANIDPGDKLSVVPFRLDQASETEPTLFEATILLDGVRYQYGFTATNQRIYDEWLTAYPKNRPRLWFHREYDTDSGESEYKWGTWLKGERQGLRGKTRDDALFLSVAAQWNHKQLKLIYDEFCYGLRGIAAGEATQYVTERVLLQEGGTDQDRKLLHKVVAGLLNKADLGISDVSLKVIDPSEVELPTEWTDEHRRSELERLKKNPIYRVGFSHSLPDCDQVVDFDWADESRGTRRFFDLLGPWVEVLSHGWTLFVDELELNLHPLLSRRLIELIHSRKVNKAGAQLIFATHDTTLLDPELFRRDQIYFTEKGDDGATTLYSLADYKERTVRKGEALQKGYLAGRYGAVPIVESFDKAFGLNDA